MRALWVGIVLVIGCAFAALPAAADSISAGASGQCYDGAGNGGHDEVRVVVDPHAPSATPTVPTVTGAAGGLAQFAMGIAANGNVEDDACPNGDTLDYVEADAEAEGSKVQVCYDGEVLTDGSCPTSPAGPGNPG